MVSMTYGAGVVMWVLTRRMSGEYFEELVEIEIKSALQNSGKTCNRILQDGGGGSIKEFKESM